MKSTAIRTTQQTVRVRVTTNDCLWQMLARTNHVISKLRHKELRRFGINMNDAIVLFTALRLKKLATPANISRQLFWEPHTVSEQLSGMVKKGLVKKIRDLERPNLVRVEVTEKGIQAYQKSAKRKLTREIMAVLSEDEQLQLWALMAKIRKKALSKLDLHITEPFPPDDPDQLR